MMSGRMAMTASFLRGAVQLKRMVVSRSLSPSRGRSHQGQSRARSTGARRDAGRARAMVIFTEGAQRAYQRETGDRGYRHGRGARGAGAAVGQCRDAQGRAVAGQDRLHRCLEGAGGRAADGAPSQHRRRRPGRQARPRGRTAGRARLPGPVLRALAAALRARRPALRPVRREPDRRRPARRRGLHRRPVPHRPGGVRGSQPRVTCYRVGLRFGEPELPALLVSHHRPGFYMRVITEGRIQAGDAIVKTRTGPGALSVADTDALLYLPGHDERKLRVALQIPALSPGWQGSFRDLLAAADDGGTATPPAATEPAWSGFRPLRVAQVVP